MNQDSSFPPMLPPSSELCALLFAVLPCLQETYRPLASFAYHMTELTKLKNLPSVPSLKGLSGIDAFVTDKDILLRSLSFYGRMFRMPLLSNIATLLQGMQFYQTYKDILPGLFSGMGAGSDPSSAFGSMAGLFSGFGTPGAKEGSGSAAPDLFSMLGGLPPDLLSSLISGFSGGTSSRTNDGSSSVKEASTEAPQDLPPAPSTPDISIPASPIAEDIPNESEAAAPAPPDPQAEIPPTDDVYNTLYSFLSPEQQAIYEQLMHTD